MTVRDLKLTFDRRPWYVPNEGRAFEGWLEGLITEEQREAVRARTREQRAAWRPDVHALYQLVQLQSFVGRRVTVQFWDATMFLCCEDEWPHPVVAHCEGIVSLIDDGNLQPFLLMRDPVERKTGGSSGLSRLITRSAINCTLAPVADLYQIETTPVVT